MTAIYGVLIFQKQPYMVLKQNWRNYRSLLSETDEQVRIDVISALGYLGDKRAIAPLKIILEEATNGRIHEFTEFALKRLNAL
jgi:HEAT repeat protein